MINITFLGTLKDVQVLQKNEIEKLDKQLNYNYGLKLKFTQNETGDEYYFYQFGEICSKTMEKIIENQKEKRYMFLIEAIPLVVEEVKIVVMNINTIEICASNVNEINIQYNIYKISNDEICICKKIQKQKLNLINDNNEQINSTKLIKNEKDNFESVNQNKKSNYQITFDDIVEDKNKIIIKKYKKEKLKVGINNFFLVGYINSIEQIRFIKQTKDANHYRLGTKLNIENTNGKYSMYAFDTFSIELNKMSNKYIKKFNIISGNIEIIKGKTIFVVKNILSIPNNKMLDI